MSAGHHRRLGLAGLLIGCCLATFAANAGPSETDAVAWEHYFGRNGQGPDYARALALFQEGAENGSADSHYGLATLYSRALGVERDYLRARYHYELAAEGGLRRAYYNLGVLHHKGLGVLQNDIKARKYFKIAADMGEPHAFLTLGIFHEEGWGGPVTLESARAWYRRAAGEGLAEAQERLDRLMWTANMREQK